MLDILLFGFAALVLFKARFAKFGEVFDDYLSLQSTTALRGILSVGIILHHLSERVENAKLFFVFVPLGYLIVGVFFFLSGIGLMTSILKKGQSYLDDFLIHNVLYLFIVYLCFTLLYAIKKILTGEITNINYVFKSFLSFNPIASNSWYMVVLIIYYLFFYMAFKIFKSSNLKAIIAIFILQLAFAVTIIIFNAPDIWHISGFAFSIGMFWVYKKDLLDKFINKHIFLNVFIIGFLFAFFSLLPVVIEKFGIVIPYLRIISRYISTVCFAILVILICKKFKFNYRLWSKLGKISLEIYLIHGMIYEVLRSEFIYIKSDFLWCVLTVIISITISIPLDKFFKYIKNIVYLV